MQSAIASQTSSNAVIARRFPLVVLGLFILAMLVRFWRLSDQLFIQADDAWHILIIQRFAREGILEWTQARPMYPYLVGWLARLVDASPFFAAQVSAMTGALTVVVIMLWARARFGDLVAVAAGVILAFSQIQIYFSKTSGPIAPAALVVTIGYVLLSESLARVERHCGRWPGLGAHLCMLGAGLLVGLSVTIHRAYLPIPLFLIGFWLVVAVRPGLRRSMVLLPVLVLAQAAPLVLAQVLTELHQPPSINHFGYMNQLLASFSQQAEWREGPGGRSWLFFIQGFWETEGPLNFALAGAGAALFLRCWLREGDWQAGLMLWVVGTTFAYASIVSAAGGITVLRAVAPALPLVAVLGALALVRFSEYLATTTWARGRSLNRWAFPLLLAVMTVQGVALSRDVINAQTGYAEAVGLVLDSGGFVAVYDGDPWRLLTAPAPVLHVGPKRLDRSAEERARDRAAVHGTCHLLLHHFSIQNGRLIVPGAADLSLAELGEPVATTINRRERLAPARFEDIDYPIEDEIRVYRDPFVCRELDAD